MTEHNFVDVQFFSCISKILYYLLLILLCGYSLCHVLDELQVYNYITKVCITGKEK